MTGTIADVLRQAEETESAEEALRPEEADEPTI